MCLVTQFSVSHLASCSRIIVILRERHHVAVWRCGFIVHTAAVVCEHIFASARDSLSLLSARRFGIWLLQLHARSEGLRVTSSLESERASRNVTAERGYGVKMPLWTAVR